MATFFLCITVLNMATSSKTSGNSTGACGLIIGLSVTAGAYAIGHVTDASMNPAVTFGLCGSAGQWGGAQWRWVLVHATAAPGGAEGLTKTDCPTNSVYLPAQMVAAALAVGTYLDLHLNSKEDIEDVPAMKALWCCMPCLK